MRCWFAALAALLAVQFTSVAHAQAAVEDAEVVPSLGVPVEPSRGLFADLHVGTFFTVGGTSGVSDAAPYLGLMIGYDINDSLQVGAGFGFGASTNTCFNVDPAAPGICSGADSFSILMLDGFAAYMVAITGQWYVGARLAGGLAMLSPRPHVDVGADPLGTDFGFNAGGLASTEFHTYLNHLVVGLDAGVHFISGGGESIIGIAIYPRLKYVF